MTLENFLSTISQIVYLYTAVSTFIIWVRYRTPARLDIALVFISLAIAILAQDLEKVIPAIAPFSSLIFLIFLLGQPYLLLRVTRYFRPIPVMIQRAGWIGLILVYISLLFLNLAPLPISIFAVVYFLAFEGYASFLLFERSRQLRGVISSRLILIAIGSSLLTLIFVIALIFGVVASVANWSTTSIQATISLLIQFVAIFSGLSFFFGFSPPRWLRQFWQFRELYKHLLHVARLPASDHKILLQELSTAALQIVGGTTAIVIGYDNQKEQLTVEVQGEPPIHQEALHENGILASVLHKKQSQVVQMPNASDDELNKWGEKFGAKSLFVVPMETAQRPWGILILGLNYAPLFAQDDLDLLNVMVKQSAVLLDNSALIEDTLRASNERYYQVLENMLEGAQIIGFDWRYQYINTSAAEQGHQPKENLIGHTMMEVYPGIEQTELFALMRDAMSNRTRHHVENEFFYPDGSKGWFELSIQPISEGIFILSMDVSQRKLAEEELEQRVKDRTISLHETTTFLDSVVESIPTMLFVKDAQDLRFIRFNKAAELLLGHSRETMIGKNDYDFFPKKEADFFIKKDREVLSQSQVVDIPEETIQTAHFGTRYLHTRKVPILDNDGMPKYLLGISEDITERKNAEEKIKTLNEDLDRRARELEAANKELEAFSYSVSHDLRAPLRSIDGFSHAVLEDYGDQLPKEGRDYLERVRGAAQRMAELIDDLLNLSRITRSPLQPKSFNISSIVEEITQALQETQPERKTRLSIEQNLTVNADPNLVRIALENLLGNAWKFTSKQEHASIEFGTQNMDNRIVYFVRDNGAGFDMTYASKLFGVFQRLHAITDFPGTGVGLATVKRIINIHGGEIWAEGVEGKGATFYFTLQGEKHGK